MAEDYSDKERNPLVPYYISSKGTISHTISFITPVMEHWLQQEIVQSIGQP